MKKIYLSFFATLFVFSGFSQSTTLVISQVYGGGGNSGSTYTNDFIEIFNKGNTPVNLNGYSVQYASSAGAAWSVTNLSNIILQPGQYYLVQEAAGSGGTTPLPTPDATGAITMGGTGFKVALVNTTAALSGTCPTGSSIIDFVGCSSGANCFEGAFGPAPSNTNSISRKLNGCQDTQNNSSDFTAGAAAPRNTATALNPCSVVCSVPSQKPTNIRYGGSPSNTSMTVYFTRSNGTGSLVLCRQAGPVNTTPTSGTTYTTSTTFGTGTPINTDNYPVFSTTYKDVNAFTLTGLTAGTKYYFSVFEYNDPGKCYTTTGLVDSFTVGGNILNTGDMAFVGWDNTAVNPGEDKLYIMAMVDINKGTRFSLVNSRFESGATANTRTNRWYGGGDDPYQNPYCFEFEYSGSTPLAKGSVISTESNAISGFTNFTVDGVAAAGTDFTTISNGTTSNFLSTSGGDQVYIVQGKFTPYGTAGSNRYNLLNGNVIHGFTTGLPWVPFTTAVSTAIDGTGRESRIPPQILCTAVEFNVSGNTYGVYKHSAGTSGTKNQLLTNFKNNANWAFGAGTNNTNDVPLNEANVNSPFTVTSSGSPEGRWIGNSIDWFECNNWEGLHVPDSTTNTSVGTGSFSPYINITTSINAVQYSNIARTAALTVAPAGSGLVFIAGAGNEKLIIEDALTVAAGGALIFESNANALNDTMWIHNGVNVGNATSFVPGLGTIVFDEARTTAPYGILRTGATTELVFNNLAMSNTRSVDLLSPVTVINNLNLQNGYINSSAAGTLTLSAATTLTSPANIYGQSNKGYFNSFVNGKMYYDAAAATGTRVFPIGKYSTTDTAYAPVELIKTNTTATTYNAEYFAAPYSDLTVDPGQLDHVSLVEHWLINSSAAGADAQVTLSWRPKSEVGYGTSSPVVFDSLMVAHYFDPGSGSALWNVDGGSNVIMTKNSGYNLNYGLITTIAATSTFSPFTLATRGNYSSLPVKLLTFTGTINSHKVSLQWLTAEEQSVDRYEVEKSTDGVHFSLLNNVNSVNATGHHTYNSMDNGPAEGWNYYRLRIVDKAGKPVNSGVVRVWNNRSGNFVIYPNPATDEIKINLPASSSISNIEVVNSNGQVVKQLTTTQQSLTINIESLSKGVYFIRILNSRQAIAQKFTKQ